MIESSRTKFLKRIFKNEIKALLYEEYNNNHLKLLRTFMLLNDEFYTLLRLDEIGIWSEDKIHYLEKLNYKDINSIEIKKTLKIK